MPSFHVINKQINMTDGVNENNVVLEKADIGAELLEPASRCFFSLWSGGKGYERGADARDFLLDKLTDCFMQVLGERKDLGDIKSLEDYFDKIIHNLEKSGRIASLPCTSRAAARSSMLIAVYERMLFRALNEKEAFTAGDDVAVLIQDIMGKVKSAGEWDDVRKF